MHDYENRNHCLYEQVVNFTVLILVAVTRIGEDPAKLTVRKSKVLWGNREDCFLIPFFYLHFFSSRSTGRKMEKLYHPLVTFYHSSIVWFLFL